MEHLRGRQSLGRFPRLVKKKRFRVPGRGRAPYSWATTSLGDCVNRREPIRIFPSGRRLLRVNPRMSFQHNVGIVPRNRLRWGKRTLQRRIFESGNQEPRKMGFLRWKVKVSAAIERERSRASFPQILFYSVDPVRSAACAAVN